MVEPVDGLLGVPDSEKRRARGGAQGLQQRELKGVRVLELVRQDVPEPSFIVFIVGRVRLLRRTAGVEDHVGERQEPSPPLHLVPQAPGRPAEPEERGAQAALRPHNLLTQQGSTLFAFTKKTVSDGFSLLKQGSCLAPPN